MFKVIEKHAAQMLAQGNPMSVGLSPASHLLKKTLFLPLIEILQGELCSRETSQKEGLKNMC